MVVGFFEVAQLAAALQFLGLPGHRSGEQLVLCLGEQAAEGVFAVDASACQSDVPEHGVGVAAEQDVDVVLQQVFHQRLVDVEAGLEVRSLACIHTTSQAAQALGNVLGFASVQPMLALQEPLQVVAVTAQTTDVQTALAGPGDDLHEVVSDLHGHVFIHTPDGRRDLALDGCAAAELLDHSIHRGSAPPPVDVVVDGHTFGTLHRDSAFDALLACRVACHVGHLVVESTDFSGVFLDRCALHLDASECPSDIPVELALGREALCPALPGLFEVVPEGGLLRLEVSPHDPTLLPALPERGGFADD